MSIVGQKIVAIERLSDDELRELDWDRSPAVLVLEDGTRIFPSQDDEGNGNGTMFTSHPQSGDGYLFAPEEG